MEQFKPGLLPISLGSLPFASPILAWETMFRHFPEIPAWPQLPQRTFLENMYVQFSAGFPGVVLDNDRIFVDRTLHLEGALEKFYVSYLSDDLDAFATTQEYAAALWVMDQALAGRSPPMLKGQVTGPISWGLMVVDQERRPVLYDDILADAVARHMRMKAAWQERYLSRYCERTILFLDEPYLSAFGSAFVSLDRPLVSDMLEETLAGIAGLKGIHCCGNTDWSLLLSTSVDVLSLDAYGFGDTFSLYPEDIGRFLERGGMVAWGIVPSDEAAEGETPESLLNRFEGIITVLEGKGVSRERLLESGFISPACGTGGLSPALAEHVLALTRQVSLQARARYFGKADLPNEVREVRPEGGTN